MEVLTTAPAGTHQTDSLFDFGPRQIAQSTLNAGPSFVLTTAEWLRIQTFVLEGLILPTTPEKFRESIGVGAPADLSDFDALLKCYASINQNCLFWRDTAYPKSMDAVAGVINYARNSKPYFAGILEMAQRLIKNPNDTEAKKDLIANLEILKKYAQQNQVAASTTAANIKRFADQATLDRLALVGVDGKGGLQKHYNTKYGESSAEAMQLQKDMQTQIAILREETAKYNHNVVVAATTPTYWWVPIAGWIAGPIVAGVFGARATAALNAVNAATEAIKKFEAKIAANTQMILAIARAGMGIREIAASLQTALPLVQKLQGVWGAIESDILNLQNVLATDIDPEIPRMIEQGVKNATNRWDEVAALADSYRKNAYVVTQQ